MRDSFNKNKEKYRTMQKNIFEGRIIDESVDTVYKVGDKLGSGSYGEVRIVHKKSYKNKKFALKSIHRDTIQHDIVSLERELDILLSIDHPNIIEFEEIYMDNNYFNFVT
jgi:serine/threonine protein kinase